MTPNPARIAHAMELRKRELAAWNGGGSIHDIELAQDDLGDSGPEACRCLSGTMPISRAS
jgi:hypothetical protein